MVRRKEMKRKQRKLNETLSCSSKVGEIQKLKKKLEKQIDYYNDQILSGYADSTHSEEEE